MAHSLIFSVAWTPCRILATLTMSPAWTTFGTRDRVWLSIAGGKNVRGAPRGFQRVDADDDLPSAIAAALHRGADLIACAQLFVRGHRVLEVEDQRVGASNLAFSNARSLEPGI
jgi:hypothetical protein